MTSESSHRRRARAQLVAAAVLFSTGGAVIKAATLTAWQVASFRSGIAALAVTAMLPAARRAWKTTTVSSLLVAAAYAATMILFVQANKLTTSANAIYLQSTAPIYLLILGPWLLHEPNRPRDFGFMSVMAVGLALFFVGTEPPVATAPRPFAGNVVALASGVCWAGTVAGMRWLGRNGEDHSSAVNAVVVGNALAFLICLPMALPARMTNAIDWTAILYLGIFQIGVAYVCVTAALRHIPALEASLLLLVEPVLNPVWSWLVHGERPSAWAACGGILILAATAIKARFD
jgi:drug/metabolite transporter (DMT)-like permease